MSNQSNYINCRLYYASYIHFSPHRDFYKTLKKHILVVKRRSESPTKCCVTLLNKISEQITVCVYLGNMIFSNYDI